MKTIILVFILFGFFGFCSAQDKPDLKQLEPEKFIFNQKSNINEFLKKSFPIPYYAKQKLWTDIPEDLFSKKEQQPNLEKYMKFGPVYSFNMPIYNPLVYCNMPVLVPDSTIEFTIAQKRFEIYNRFESGMELKWK